MVCLRCVRRRKAYAYPVAGNTTPLLSKLPLLSKVWRAVYSKLSLDYVACM